jgi:phage shock protein C
MNTIQNTCREHGLVRLRKGRVFAGVCAGLARRFGMDPWMARLLFVLLILAVHGSPILLYVILWIIMPEQETATDTFDTTKSQHFPTS